MIGNIGNGKSTILNKLETAINIANGVSPDKANLKKFKAKAQTGSCTLGMHPENVTLHSRPQTRNLGSSTSKVSMTQILTTLSKLFGNCLHRVYNQK